jgi:DNA-binding GntR family transcriptional regulator
MNEPASTLTALKALQDPQAPAADSVYRALRQGIITGVLAPGARLGEEALAGELKVSRTPVREALLRLEAENLADRAPRRGLIVSRVSPEEIIEVYRVRQVIDGLAAELAAESAASQDIMRLAAIHERFERANHDGDVPALLAANLQFHEAIAEAGRNHVLLMLMRQIHDRVRRFQGTTFTEPGRADAVLAEHARMLEAIQRRDPAAASKEAREHMGRALFVRISMLSRLP